MAGRLDTQGKRLSHAILRLAGYRDRAAFARALGVKPVTLRQQINRGSIPPRYLGRYIRSLKRWGVTADWILRGAGSMPGQQRASARRAGADRITTIPVAYTLGPGDEMRPLARRRRDVVAAPPGFEDGAAAVIQGSALPPFEEGDILIFRARTPPPVTRLPQRAVIAELDDGQLLFKKLLPATRGRYHLISPNATTAPLLAKRVVAIAAIGWVHFGAR